MNIFIRLAALVAASNLLTACELDSNNILGNLNKNRAKWENANIDTYQFEYSKSCNCMLEDTLPRLVVVNAGQVVSQTIIESHVALPLDQVSTESIAGLFERIALEESRAKSVTVEYDPELGYPTKIKVDISKRIADDEYTVYVSNVVNSEDVACTTEVLSGLNISIVDSSTQNAAACGVTVTATEGDFSESVYNTDVGCDDSALISMLDERPGFYTLTFEKSGYQAYQIDNVGIGQDLCHVLPRQLDVELSPQ